MTKFEWWERCNTCWTCKYRKMIDNRIHCGHSVHGGTYKRLLSVDIIMSVDCEHRVKEKRKARGKYKEANEICPPGMSYFLLSCHRCDKYDYCKLLWEFRESEDEEE